MPLEVKKDYGWDRKAASFPFILPKVTKQEFTNWYVPAELDTVGFDLVSKSMNQASFKKQFTLVNYSGTELDIGIDRTIEPAR